MRALIVRFIACVIVTKTAHAQPQAEVSPEALLGPCTQSMTAPRFAEEAELRVLVTRFAGADGSRQSIQFGASLGFAIHRVLPVYMRKVIDADARKTGLRDDALSVAYVPCLLTDHAKAREIGAAWGADLVIWGAAQTTTAQDTAKLVKALEKQAENLNVASHNVVDAPNATSVLIKGTVNITVKAPTTGATFQTSMTVVRWGGLEAEGSGSRVSAILDQDFPRLATEQPLALFYLILGHYAYHGSRFGVAARFFEQAAESTFASADRQEFLYGRIASSYVQANMVERAIPLAKKALESCPSDDKTCRALYLNNLAWVLERSKTPDKATATYKEAAALAKEIGDPYLEGTATNNLAALLMAADPKGAIELLKQALALRRQAADLIGEGSTLHNLGAAHLMLNDRKTAKAFLLQALPLRRRGHDVAGEAATLNVLAQLSLREPDYATTLTLLGEQQAANRLLGDHLRELQIQMLMMEVAQRHGDAAMLSKAEDAFRKLIDSKKVNLAAITSPTALNNIGKAFYNIKEFKRATGFYERALAAYKKAGDKVGEGLSENNIGKVFYARGEYRQALKHYERGLPLLQTEAGAMHRDYLLHNLGLVHLGLNNPRLGITYLEQASQLRESKADVLGQVETLRTLASAYSRSSRVEDAVARSRTAAFLLLRTVPPNPGQAAQTLELALRWAEDAERDDLAKLIRADMASVTNK